MDNEKDLYIKEKLQNDKLISKNADDIINKFFDMEDVRMKEKSDKQENNKKISFMQKWRKILVTAASIVVIFGVANVYASTKGYGNIFFLIKYLITGENSYVSGKDGILTDRDLTISYEPINITENIKIIIKKLQIKGNEAKLFVIVDEQLGLDSKIVPLKYKVFNDDNNLLCDQKSGKNENTGSYTDELVLKNYKEDNTKLKMEIYSAKSELITTININLQDQTIEVVGEQEALSKISEIELKKFLNYVSGLSDNSVTSRDEKMIRIAIEKMNFEDISQNQILSDYGTIGYPVDEVNELIGYCFSDDVAKTIRQGETIERIKKNGKEYYVVLDNTDGSLTGECININNISFCNGLYTVTYTFYHRGIEPDEDIDMNNYEIYEQTVYIRINDNNKYSKFKLVSDNKAEMIRGTENSNTSERVNENTHNTIANTISNTTNTATYNTTVNNTTVNSNTNNSNIVTENSSNTVPSPSVNTNTTTSTTIDNSNDETAENINNYASTMSWTEYWAPGLRFQYPTEFELVEEGGYYRGTNQGEITTRITGLAIGKNVDTNKKVVSKLMIKVFNPRFISAEEYNIRMSSAGRYGTFENNRGIVWKTMDDCQSDDPGYSYSEVYSHFEYAGDSNSYVETQIEFVTDNIENLKVRNIINWLLGSTQLTSW